MTTSRRLSWIAAAACAVANLSTIAQQTQVPGTFRSAVTLVPVDVRVLDRDGKPVTDLGLVDFTLSEDGIAQQIRHFSAQMLVPEPPEARPKSVAPNAAPLAPQKQRIFLIVFGRGRLQHPSKGVDAMIQFVRGRLLPQDQVAVMAYNRATDFTNDHERVAQMLERFRRGHEWIEARLALRFSGLAGIYGQRSIPERVQSEIDAVFLGEGGLAFRTLPPGRVTDSGRIAEDARRVTGAVLSGDLTAPGQRPAATSTEPGVPYDLSLDEYVSNNTQTMSDLENLYTGIEYLRYLDGEKHLVFVTEHGLFLPRVEDDTSIAAMANDARVVLDTIQTGGVSGGPSPTARGPLPLPGPTLTESFAIYTLRTMSELTGGHASAYGYADDALQTIDSGSRFQYLLGYSPSKAQSDGRYRRINVTVKRPGVKVLYRRGYYGRQQLVPYDRQRFLTYSRTLAAALYSQNIRDIKVKLKANPVRTGEGTWAVEAEITIDMSRLELQEKDGRREISLDIALFCVGVDGKGLGEMWRKFNISLSNDDYARALRSGVSYTMRVPATNRARMAKVVVYDYWHDVIGTAESVM